jgi:anhydro-N-acetylmuramic acid kinase
MTTSVYAVGLMSGTSVDGIDAVVVEITGGKPVLCAARSDRYSPRIREEILALCHPGANEIDRLGALDRELGILFSTAALSVIADAGLNPRDIAVIGSHGQTVRHRPTQPQPFTLQIADPNIIAETTGITTVGDFRRRDMAAGGQGAPLVPFFHQEILVPKQQRAAVVNIGGIANVTLISPHDDLLGFDCGPGNTLMDQWIARIQGRDFDADGEWARTGQVHPRALDALLDDPYFALSAPKSTGPEYFNLAWCDQRLARRGLTLDEIPPADVQRTLLELTAESISATLRQTSLEALVVCGGGAHNRLLRERLQALLSPLIIRDSEAWGIHPDWVEACAFAWFAQRTLEQQPSTAPSVTGAKRATVIGGVYYP